MSMMKKDPTYAGMESRLKEFYGNVQLTESELADLTAQTPRGSSGRPTIHGLDSVGSSFSWAQMAAACLLAGFCVLVGARINVQNSNAHAIASEIALNHRKQLDIEYVTDNLGVLQERMTKLDFELMESRRPIMAGLTLLGARYCSIDSNIAAQMRLQNEAGQSFTLYQLRPPDRWLSKSSSENVTLDSEGLFDVSLWMENGLLYGLATEAARLPN